MKQEDLFLVTFILFFTAIFWLMSIHIDGYKRYKLVGLITQVTLALTLWLWGPWVYYGITTLYTWNVGKINDLSRPEQVTPPTPIVRPSAAERTKP